MSHPSFFLCLFSEWKTDQCCQSRCVCTFFSSSSMHVVCSLNACAPNVSLILYIKPCGQSVYIFGSQFTAVIDHVCMHVLSEKSASHILALLSRVCFSLTGRIWQFVHTDQGCHSAHWRILPCCQIRYLVSSDWLRGLLRPF